jgi:hypothetical protein
VVILDVPLGNYVSSVYTASADWRVKAPPTAWSVFSRRPAAVDEVRAFAAGILGRERLPRYTILLLQLHLPEPGP